MAIQTISLNNHHLDIKEDVRVMLESIIHDTLTFAELRRVDLYRLSGRPYHGRVGEKGKLIVFENAGEIYKTDSTEYQEILSVDGELVAYINTWNSGERVLQIIPNLLSNTESTELLKQIFEALNEIVYKQEYMDKSWKHSTKKAELTDSFKKGVLDAEERVVRDEKRRIESSEQDIKYYTEELKNRYRQRLNAMIRIEQSEERIKGVTTKLISEMDLIANNDKITDLFIDGAKIIAHTVPIYAYHDKNGDRYYIGKFRIEMNPNNTEVRFFGDNPRKSYWSNEDSHPHVSSSGSACLGNVAATIAQLCSEYELFALTMVAIDFLENVNTEDPAGKGIYNWDKVDDEGNIIVPGGTEFDEEDSWTCDCCGNNQPESESGYTAYERGSVRIDTDGDTYDENLRGEMYVCEECLDNNYTHYEEIDAYVGDMNIIRDEPEEDEEEPEETEVF